MVLFCFGDEYKRSVSTRLQHGASLVLVKRKHKLKFDVVKNRYGPEKEGLSLKEAIKLFVYRGLRRLSSRYI